VCFSDCDVSVVVVAFVVSVSETVEFSVVGLPGYAVVMYLDGS
jgi:hypothetical protein